MQKLFGSVVSKRYGVSGFKCFFWCFDVFFFFKLYPKKPTKTFKNPTNIYQQPYKSPQKPCQHLPTTLEKPSKTMPTSTNNPAKAFQKPCQHLPTTLQKPSKTLPTSNNNPTKACLKPCQHLPTTLQKPSKGAIGCSPWTSTFHASRGNSSSLRVGRSLGLCVCFSTYLFIFDDNHIPRILRFFLCFSKDPTVFWVSCHDLATFSWGLVLYRVSLKKSSGFCRGADVTFMCQASPSIFMQWVSGHPEETDQTKDSLYLISNSAYDVLRQGLSSMLDRSFHA